MRSLSLQIFLFTILIAQSRSEEELEQYTPDKSDWTTLNSKAVTNNPKVTDHTPDGISWIRRDEWIEWDGTVYDPTAYSRKDFAKLICPGNTILGLREVFYEHSPFEDVTNPTKAEVDYWHSIALMHVRALVGYTGEEYRIEPDKCLHVRALWSDERAYTRMWDTEEYPGTCLGSSNPHCGAGFIPNKEDQQDYLPDGIDYCGSTAGSEGIFNAAKSNIPWSIKWARPFCQTLSAEGFWGGHTGPWFHRTKFGWSWRDMDPDNPNSNAGLRTKWSGPKGENLYENPDVTDGRFKVLAEGVSPDPRFLKYECEGINWLDKTEENATACYNRVMGDENCGKRFMTYNTANSGCACYPVEMTVCEVLHRAGRLTWDFEPVSSSFDGLLIDASTPILSGRRCPQIKWKTSAGDASHCLQKIVEGNYADCGRKFITWNSANGGCACYPPEQTTCTREESVRESGRQTYQMEVDPSYNDPTPTRSPTISPSISSKPSSISSTPAPTASPSFSPSFSPSMKPSPSSGTTCVDPEGDVTVTVRSKVRTKPCSWFTNDKNFWNCYLKEVQEACPVFCDACPPEPTISPAPSPSAGVPCVDSEGYVTVTVGSKSRTKLCSWFTYGKKFWNCDLEAVQEACPVSCGACGN